MKIFTTEGIRRIDEATIERENISILDVIFYSISHAVSSVFPGYAV